MNAALLLLLVLAGLASAEYAVRELRATADCTGPVLISTWSGPGSFSITNTTVPLDHACLAQYLAPTPPVLVGDWVLATTFFGSCARLIEAVDHSAITADGACHALPGTGSFVATCTGGVPSYKRYADSLCTNLTSEDGPGCVNNTVNEAALVFECTQSTQQAALAASEITYLEYTVELFNGTGMSMFPSYLNTSAAGNQTAAMPVLPTGMVYEVYTVGSCTGPVFILNGYTADGACHPMPGFLPPGTAQRSVCNADGTVSFVAYLDINCTTPIATEQNCTATTIPEYPHTLSRAYTCNTTAIAELGVVAVSFPFTGVPTSWILPSPVSSASRTVVPLLAIALAFILCAYT
jgi:hypothetical protein